MQRRTRPYNGYSDDVRVIAVGVSLLLMLVQLGGGRLNEPLSVGAIAIMVAFDISFLSRIRLGRDGFDPLIDQLNVYVGNRYHEARYHRQRQGASTFLIAYLGDAPVGSGEVMWQGPKEPDVRAEFPGCPEINGLVVVAEYRSRGIGTAIIRAAERRAARRGRHRIGLGVDDHNVRAAALYARLGYADTGYRYLDRYRFVDDAGVRREVADPCRFLIKSLEVP